MESGKVEARPGRGFRAATQLVKLQRAHTVGEPLARPDQQAVDDPAQPFLSPGRGVGVAPEERDGLLPRPAHGVKARLRDEVGGRAVSHPEDAYLGFGLAVIDSDLTRKKLCITGPSFGREPRHPPRRKFPTRIRGVF
jgi:hypothetical protein